jgi:WD40 repeat protein
MSIRDDLLRGLLIVLACAMTSPSRAAEKVTYDDHVRPILQARCFACHGDDEQNADLNLQSFAAAVKGGSSGELAKAGRPNSSLLFQVVTHADGVEAMPPNGDKLPDAEIETLRQWIAGGLLENAGSKSREAASIAFKPLVAGKPDAPVMPGSLASIATPPTNRPQPVTALAASPWAPLIAVSGHSCVQLVHAGSGQRLGTLPFAEGVPFVLRFSRGGDVLLVAGGKPVRNGAAAIYDVSLGKRLGTYGDENDVVLAADISADGRLVALGGPGKTVKVFHARDGSPAYQLKKHTDWITAIEFSPDGKQLATADRAGGILLWDAPTGDIALALNEHRAAITAMSWRSDDRLLASASEDGSAIIWDMTDGFPAATLTDIHAPKREPGQYGKVPKGVLSASWTADGKLLTAGRDGFARAWDADGGKVSASPHLLSLPTRIVACDDPHRACIGDITGTVHVFDLSSPTWVGQPR